MRKALCLLIILIFPTIVRAEGKWTCFSDCNQINDLAIQGNYVWAATGGGVVRWDISDGSYKKYTTLDGLAHNDVRVVTVDKRGGVWAGSYFGGVSKYDGAAWHSCGDVHLNVLCLAIDGQGMVWAGGYGGVGRYDGSSWTIYTPADGLASFSIKTISIDTRGNVWTVSFEGGVSGYDGVSWKNHTEAGSSITASAVDTDGAVWFASDLGFTKYDGSVWKTYGNSHEFTLQSIYSMAVDTRDAMRFGAYDAAQRFFGASWKTPDDVSYSDIVSIVADNHNAVWFGVSDGGLLKFDGSGWKTYRTDETIPSNLINGVATDSRGALWFSASYGFAKYDGTKWETYHIPAGLTTFYGVSGITNIAIDSRDVIWLSNFLDGVIRYDGVSWKKYDVADGLISHNVWNVLPDNRGNVWAVTEKGISCFNGVSWKTVTEKRVELYASPPMIVDTRGGVWIGTSRFDGNVWETLATGGFTALAVDRAGDVWAGTSSKGILRYNGVSWESYSCWPLPAPLIVSIAEDAAGAIWVGTQGKGLARFDGVNWKTLTIADGLASDYIGYITVDTKGAVWICTNSGVMKYDPDPVISFAASDRTPSTFSILSVHPNPFNPSTTISYTLPVSKKTRIAIYDITGRKVRTLVSGVLPAGSHSVMWDGMDDRGMTVSSGVYLPRLEYGREIRTTKMLLMK